MQNQNARTMGEKGEEIYSRRYKAELEAHARGKYVVIEIDSEEMFLGDTPEAAIEEARARIPNGTFHLIRVGSPGVFRVSHTAARGSGDWLSGR